MDIKTLLNDSSRATMDKATKYILQNKKLLPILINLVLKEDSKYSLRASRILHFCSMQEPELIKPYYNLIIEQLKSNTNDSIKGNLLSIFYEIKLPNDDEILSELTQICFDFLNGQSERESLAIYSIDILYKICTFYPDLKNELITNLISLIPNKKKGFKSRAEKYLKLLKQQERL